MSRSERTERRYGNARERAEKQESGFSGTYLKLPKGAKLLKIKAGAMFLDVLPYPAGPGNKFAEEGVLWYEKTYYLHRNIGAANELFVCPRMSAKLACPVCEEQKRLRDENDPENEVLIKALAPKQRQLFNVIDLRNPDLGVQILDISYHLFGDTLDKEIRNSDEGDGWDAFFSLEEGLTLKVGVVDDSFGGRTFQRAESIHFKPRKEPYDEEILEKVHCLEDVLVIPSYGTLKKAFLQLENAAAAEDDDNEPPRRKRPLVEDDDAPPAKRRPRDEDEETTPKSKRGLMPEEYLDEAPKKRRPLDEEEESPVKRRAPVEDDEPPKKKRPVDELDEDEPPVKKKRDVPWDDDDAPPKKKRPVDEEEELPVKKKRPVDEDEAPPRNPKYTYSAEEDDAPPKRGVRTARDEEEEPPVKKKRPVDDEQDNDDEPPKKKRPPVEEDDAPPKKKKPPVDNWDDFDKEPVDSDDAPPKKKK